MRIRKIGAYSGMDEARAHEARVALYGRLDRSLESLHGSMETLGVRVALADAVGYEVANVAMHSTVMLERAGARRVIAAAPASRAAAKDDV